MKVRILCFGPMREYLPPDSDGRVAELEVAEGGRVRAVVNALGAPERLVFSVLVDGLRGNLESELHEGAEVTLMPPFTGGSLTRS
ncbi:MAG TPA: MoaD/ThiS family protein [Actinomycetota bacterium]|nr:MoaD/ThiS family protein [Actinomycetota bacterium]